ncbi:MAG: TolC family protein [Opitutales bacterium]|nr:TolC family protein [Opitutales bacterium]
MTSLCLIAFSGALCANGNTVRTDITLESGWDYLRDSHGALDSARHQIAAARSADASTRNLYHPQVELQLRATRINEPIEIDLNPIRQVILNLHPEIAAGQIPEFRTRVQDREFFQGSLNVVWPVYTGGRISAARSAASAEIHQSKANLMQTEAELLREYVRRYYSVALAEHAVALNAEQVESMKRHLSRAIQLEENGQIARVERLHAKVAFDKAKRDLSEAESDLRVAREGLTAWFDRPENEWALASELKILHPPVETKQQTQRDSDRHPRLLQLDALRQSAESAVQAERGALLPEVYLFGRQELNRSDLTLLDPEWAVGIGLNWNIWDRDGQRQRVRAARSQNRRIESIRAQAAKDLNTLAIQSIEQWHQSAKRFDTLGSSLELASENLRVRELAFSEGQATSLDVVDARLTYQRVLLARAVSQYESLVYAATTAEALGSTDLFWKWIQPKDIR